MISKNLSFWEQASFDANYDLIVVGAGIVGLSSAYFYKRSRKNARVLVLERGYYPEGASTKNAGFACFGSITELLDDLKTEPEAEVKARIIRRYRGLELLRNELGAGNIRFEATGGYEIFNDEAEYEEAISKMPMFNEWLGEVLSQRNVYTPDQCGPYPSIKNRLEGSIHTGDMMASLIRKTMDAGVEIRFNTPLVDFSEDRAWVSDGIELSFKNILFATNGFSARLLPELNIKPARGYVMVTKPILGHPWRGVYHYDKGYIYFRNIEDRILLGGARNVDFEGETTDAFGTNERIKNRLLDFAQQVLSMPQGWEIDYEWSGIMGFAETKNPILKQLGPRWYIAAGLGGMGVAIGMGLGKEAASLIGLSTL
jgi:glycine/D-amino acid oxidase-like deaminating enzyme